MAKVNLLTIEDNTVQAILRDPTIKQLLPCLNAASSAMATLDPGGKNCNRCARTKAHVLSDSLSQAKRCIANTRGATLTKLKERLNANKLRIVARNGKGQAVQWTL